MAGTNTYVITSVTELGDVLTVTGTVNGVPMTVTPWVSAAGNALASAIAFEAFIAPLMLAAAQPPVPAVVPDLTLTFTR